MPMNKHGRSREFNSLMQCQNREMSISDDSVECDVDSGKRAVNLENASSDVSSMLSSLNLKDKESTIPGLHKMDEEHSACTSSTTNDSNKSDNEPEDALINFSFTQSPNNSKESSDSLFTTQNIINTKQSKKTYTQFSHLNANKKLSECTTLSSDSETIKASSCNSSVRKCSKKGPQNDHSSNSNEENTKNITVSSDSGTLKLSSCNSSKQNIAIANIKENQLNEDLIELYNEDNRTCEYFSSPTEFPQNNEQMLSMMEEPDMWDDLIALEETLSLYNEKESKSQAPCHVLNRLSEQFKKTPSRFTEKLVSIIEKSVISESPSKPNAGNCSGISLDRMSGEFRKMCKFIADESMPDWALMNTTYLNKTETPELEENKDADNVESLKKNKIRNVQKSPCTTPKAFKSLLTPKNNSRSQTPINRFTPSADKSFEYWERVCNIMCQNQGSATKNVVKPVTVPEPSKLSMDEMLTICERQMASLDDSTIDMRNSEPCKNTDSEIKLKLLQVPRSKSSSKISSTKQTVKSGETKRRILVENDKKNEVKNINELLKLHNNFDILEKDKHPKSNENDGSHIELLEIDSDSNKSSESEDSYQLSRRSRRSNVHANKDDENTSAYDDSPDSFKILTNNQRSSVHQKKKQVDKLKADFELLPFSPPPQMFCDKLNSENLCDNEDDQDYSLLIELAKRRQRCLETAKLMREIDNEDPTSNDKDKTCLETLYKLGIQDETFPDIEEDRKFINTLNHCFEYKNYIRDKSKPIMNMLQKYNSPENLQKRASVIMSKKLIEAKPKALNLNTKNSKIALMNKPRLMDPKNVIKSLQSKTMTPSKKPLLRTSSTSEKKTFGGFQGKVILKIAKNPLPNSKVQQPISTNKLNKTPTVSEKVTPRIVTKGVSRMTRDEVKKGYLQSQVQPKNATPKSKPTVNINITPKISSKPALKQQSPVSDATKPMLQNIVHSSNDSPVLRERSANITPEIQPPKRRFFVTPGKSPNVMQERKKPASYFRDWPTKKSTPQKDYNKIESPLSLYIKGTDSQLVQNAQTRTNDRLLTPISTKASGESSKLKFNLASKENTSPAVHGAENIILPTIRYQSAKKVRLTNDESPYTSLQSLIPNSRTKKLLEPVESTVVIRHEGRVIDYNPKSKSVEPDMSIRAQHVAEKASITRRNV